MSIASKYNHGARFNVQFSAETPFTSLADLYNNNGAGYVYLLRALFINHKSRYGESPVAVVGEGENKKLIRCELSSIYHLVNLGRQSCSFSTSGTCRD